MVKVFLVDDEIVIREGIRNSFPWEESGYTLVGEAPDGEIRGSTGTLCYHEGMLGFTPKGK